LAQEIADDIGWGIADDGAKAEVECAGEFAVCIKCCHETLPHLKNALDFGRQLKGDTRELKKINQAGI
jgi:hypothetical protein